MNSLSRASASLGNCAATAIGSLPHTDAREALDVVLSQFRKIPLWPQLPMRCALEGMYLQYGEGMPCLRLQDERVFFETTRDVEEELERFYEHLLADDVDYFALSEERASGLYMLMHRSSEVAALEPLAVKGHVTGPVSFGFTLTDEARKPIFYHQAIMEAVTQTLRMKIRWQVKRLQSVNPRVVIFIDEPYLGAMGSALIRLSPEEILEHIGALIGEIRESGAVSGIHCCANTDWGLLLRSGVDIISFDAYSYGDKFLLFQDALPPFLEKGGLLCWGIVPTSAEVEQEDSQSLLRRMEPYLQKLETRGFPREMILRSSLISPSCGMGTLPLDTARTVMGLTIEVSSALAAGLGRRPAHD